MATSIGGSTPSRYDATPFGTDGATRTGAVDNRVVSSGNSTESSSQNQSGTQNQAGTSTTTTNQVQTNLDARTIALLNTLLSRLNGEAGRDLNARRDQLAFLGDAQSDYSKNQAFVDAQALISQGMRRSLEQMLPGIRAATEGAGSSGGALQALLMQDAAQRAAESGGALGVQTATQYGQVSGNFANLFNTLLSSAPGSVEALLQAANVLKGAVTTTTGTQTTNSSQQTTTNQQTNSSGSKSASENKSTDYAPFQVSGPGPVSAGPSTAPVYFGPSNDPVNLSRDMLSMLSTTRAFDELFIGR
jgi:hypothetical protein